MALQKAGAAVLHIERGRRINSPPGQPQPPICWKEELKLQEFLPLAWPQSAAALLPLAGKRSYSCSTSSPSPSPHAEEGAAVLTGAVDATAVTSIAAAAADPSCRKEAAAVPGAAVAAAVPACHQEELHQQQLFHLLQQLQILPLTGNRSCSCPSAAAAACPHLKLQLHPPSPSSKFSSSCCCCCSCSSNYCCSSSSPSPQQGSRGLATEASQCRSSARQEASTDC